MVKETIYDVLQIERGNVKVDDMDAQTAMLLLVGSYSIGNMSPKVNMDAIVNCADIKRAVNEALDIIKLEIPSLKKAIDLLKPIQLTDEDLAKVFVSFKAAFKSRKSYAQAFEYMIEYTANECGKMSGEYVTPKWINQLAVQLTEPMEGTFYDGTFGIGGSAIEAYEYAKENEQILDVYGQEINEKTYALACIRLYLNGISPKGLKNENILQKPLLVEQDETVQKFDTIIMQPPFGMTWKSEENLIIKDQYARFIYGVPGISSAEWLFISAALKALTEKGKAVIITTLGVLFRAGAEENIRKRLLGFDYVETVIELTNGLFTNTGIPCAMIVLNMNKAEQMRNKIQFINADTLYENVRRGKKIINDAQVKRIVQIYKDKEVVEGLSSIIKLSELEEGNLSPARYVIKTSFDSTACGKVNVHINQLSANKVLGELGTFYRGINVTSKNVQDSQGKYKIINLADIKEGMVDIELLPTYTIENNARVEAYKVESGDLIISNKGPTKICVIPEHEGEVLISQNFIGVHLKAGYNAEYIKAYLESPVGEYLIASRKTGSAVAMISIKDLKALPMVVIPLEKQKEVINQYHEEMKKVQEEMKALQNQLNGLKMNLYDRMGLNGVFNK